MHQRVVEGRERNAYKPHRRSSAVEQAFDERTEEDLNIEELVMMARPRLKRALA